MPCCAYCCCGLSGAGHRLRAAILWNWSRFGLGLVLALPAFIALIFDTRTALALAVGILHGFSTSCAPPSRTHFELVIAATAGVGLVLGSLLGRNALLAVTGLFAICLGASLAALRSKAVRLALSLAVLKDLRPMYKSSSSVIRPERLPLR